MFAKIAEYEGKKMINVPYSNEWEDSKIIQSMPRKYTDGNYFVPLTYNNANTFLRSGYLLDEELMDIIVKTREREKEVIRTVSNELYDFQKEGVSFAETQNGRFLNAMEPGLGKSCTTLTWMGLHGDKKPAIIVCPATLKLNWKRETEKWLTSEVEVLKGIKPYPTTKDVLIINYDILYAWVSELKKKNPQIMVLDEVQLIKSKAVKRSKAVRKLKDIPHIIALSGTPILNRSSEIDNILDILAPGYYPEMCDFSDGKIHTILNTSIMFRKLKKDVLKDLPPKVYAFIPIEIDNRDEYNKAEKDFIEFVRQEKGDAEAERLRRFEGLVKVEGLKQLATKGKMKGIIDWIRLFLDSGEKLVVFCTHKKVVEVLMEEFVAVKVDGSCSATQKQKAVDEFQTGDVKLFVGNSKAAGVGLNLTAASNVAMIELPWNPAEVEQSLDRCHRIGTKDSVTAYYLLAENTIEERIAALLDKKRVSIDAMIDGIQTPEDNLITELINTYNN